MIITIGREYGSGGREIGELVAKKLGVPFYDKEILTRAAQESGLCEEVIKGLGYATFSDAFTFALLIVVLCVKPTGLFGEKITDKV